MPLGDHTTVQLAHGGGGRLMRGLIEGMFLPAFAAGSVSPPHDSAVIELDGRRLAFTTDSFVVSPLFFPGGDIGKLAVYGTVNDLAMAGAKPLCLSAAFILEEGFEMDQLRRVVASMRQAADEVGVQIVTGDTKVVDRGKGDGIYVNTAGIGVVPPGVNVSPTRVVAGDAVLVSGDLGRHGIAIMSVREGLSFEGALDSDCASLAGLVEKLTQTGDDVHCLRDLTRGGLAAALNEIAEHAAVGIELEESAVPVAAPVAGACELLGLDPLYVANEGRLVAFVPAEAAEGVLEVMRAEATAGQPAIIGTVTDELPGVVQIRSLLGGSRIVDLLSGEQMPRIC
ncbi:MAG: hydrogenase expression/formation protein HypE [Candidatus Nealsonbacteria bacterium]|nr:hydrogenase expression/formation protein HypE [Candidatus Nealsonbacteria bacterium]